MGAYEPGAVRKHLNLAFDDLLLRLLGRSLPLFRRSLSLLGRGLPLLGRGLLLFGRSLSLLGLLLGGRVTRASTTTPTASPTRSRLVLLGPFILLSGLGRLLPLLARDDRVDQLLFAQPAVAVNG
jgi:hypothetical protein